MEVLFWSTNIQRPLPGVESIVKLNSEISGWYKITCFTDPSSPGCSVVHAETDLRGGVVELGVITGEEIGSEENFSIYLIATLDSDHAFIVGDILLPICVSSGWNPICSVVDYHFHVTHLSIQI